MYVMNRIERETAEDAGTVDLGGDMLRPLMVLAVLVTLAVVTMFACYYTSDGMACPAGVALEQC